MGQRANARPRSDEMMERVNPQSMALPNPSLLQPAIGALSHSPHSFLALQVSERMLSIPDLHWSHCIPAEKQSYSPPEALLRLSECSAAFPKAHSLTFPRFNELDGKTGAIRSPDNDKQLAFSAENQRLKRFHQMYAQNLRPCQCRGTLLEAFAASKVHRNETQPCPKATVQGLTSAVSIDRLPPTVPSAARCG